VTNNVKNIFAGWRAFVYRIRRFFLTNRREVCLSARRGPFHLARVQQNGLVTFLGQDSVRTINIYCEFVIKRDYARELQTKLFWSCKLNYFGVAN